MTISTYNVVINSVSFGFADRNTANQNMQINIRAVKCIICYYTSQFHYARSETLTQRNKAKCSMFSYLLSAC